MLAFNLIREYCAFIALDLQLNGSGPAVLNFFCTSRTTICLLSNQEFSRLQQQLCAECNSVGLMLIAIDPEKDSTARLHC